MAENEERDPAQVVAEDGTQADEGMIPDEGQDGEHLAALLEDARNKADEHWNELLRLRAEMDNLRKRSERELENAHKYALEKFANELLPVRDSLEMGVTAARAEGAEVEALREGSELTLKMLAQVMEKFGIHPIDPEGEKFDPDRHQAMSMVETPEAEPNTVINVFQKGYTLNDRLLRPAAVVVARGGASAAVDEQA